MRRFWTVSGGLATAASLGIAAVALRANAKSPTPEPAPPARAAAADAPGSLAPRGAGSCAAAACHGSATPVGPEISHAKRDEHTTWITADPHAGAYDVLLSERSVRIAKNLNKRAKEPKEAHEDPRCLACHATPTAGSASADRVALIRGDGVGCESCHGPSGGWISAHTTADWKALSADQKHAAGFTDLTNIGTRVETCAGCHVGAAADPARGLPTRDMNHDLIAAGHPRLSWEFAANSANYPRHWRPEPIDTDDAQLWKIGQVASMKAALDLLADRATRASSPKVPDAEKAPWPEFSEYGCFSCHFGLKEKSLRVNRDPAVKLGSPAWGSWYVPMVKVLADSDPGASDVKTSLATLRSDMNGFGVEAAKIPDLVAPLRAGLDKWLKSPADSRLNAADIASLIATLETPGKDGGRAVVTSWDSAAQLYLALASLYRSQARINGQKTLPEPIAKTLETFRTDLEFKDGLDSPANFNPSTGKTARP